MDAPSDALAAGGALLLGSITPAGSQHGTAHMAVESLQSLFTFFNVTVDCCQFLHRP